MKKTLSEKLIIVMKLVSFLSLIGLVIGLITFNSVDDSDPLPHEEPVYIETWTVTDPNGKVFTVGRSYRNSDGTMGTFVMDSKLPDGIRDRSYLCFITGGDTEVYIGGELRKDFFEARDVKIPGGIAKRFLMLVPLGSGDSGADVTIRRIGTTRRGHIFQEPFVTTDGALLTVLKDMFSTPLTLAQILLAFSLVIVVVAFVMRLLYKRRIEMLYGAMGILVISAWIVTNSFLYPFTYGHYYIDGILNYILCLLMPFSLLIYLDALQQGRYRKIVIALLGLSFANLVTWTTLHFAGIFQFQNALLYIDIILGAVVLTMAAVLVRETVTGKIREYKYTAIGVVGFIVCALSEILILNVFPSVNDEIPMLLGLAFMLTLAVVQQIVDLRKISEERRKAIDLSEAKTRFLASMSHEIRTPINAVLGMNEMILRENKDPVIAEYAQTVKSSGKMLLMMVNDVLDFSKIEAGKMEIANAEYSLSSLLRDIRPMLKERADEKSLDFRVEIEGEVPDRQISDEFRIRQMLINLINNAIKYTDKGSVKLTVSGKYVEENFLMRMSVNDTGRGITEEDRQHLFEAFSRADIKRNRSIEGTGLGLAIVKSILDSMDGTIDVTSTYGQGSTFSFELPVGVADREPVAANFLEVADSPVTADPGGDFTADEARVLTVDDTAMNLKLVSLLLKRVGIKPDTCENGRKAVEMCCREHYDLILLDHMMPGMDGIETLRMIRETEESKNKDTLAVVLTANAVAGSRDLYLDAGFVDYLTKPVDSTLLEQTVKRYLPPEKIKSNNQSD